uniref:Uncharacterized protein n=1 Tax=Anguilla anguilla TaxID=7936 RepID=A0A0E9RGI9_ANGAN
MKDRCKVEEKHHDKRVFLALILRPRYTHSYGFSCHGVPRCFWGL